MSVALASITACAGGRSEEPTLVPTTAENASGALERGMANCPSAVPGARSRVDDIQDGVAVTILAANPRAEAQIRQRARFHASRPPNTQMRKHSGRGTGGGRIGFCPVVQPGTELVVQEVPGGTRIIMRAADEREVQRLRAAVRGRVNQLSAARAMIRERERAAGVTTQR